LYVSDPGLQPPRAAHAISAQTLRHALLIAARQNGSVLNRSQFARELHLSTRSVGKLIRAMASFGWIRLLPAYCPADAAGCFRRPRLSLTSGKVLSAVLGAAHKGGADAAALAESIIRTEQRHHPASRFFYYGTYDRGAVDLIVEREDGRFGFHLAGSEHPRPRETFPLRRAVRKGIVRRGYLLHPGQSSCFFARGVLSVPRSLFLARYQDFTCADEGYRVWQLMLRWLYAAREAPPETAATNRISDSGPTGSASPSSAAAPSTDTMIHGSSWPDGQSRVLKPG
jgi:hypothetical protein